MTNRELGYIIKEIQKNEAIKLAPLAKKVEINRSYLSTLINSEEDKEIDDVLVGKIARQFPAYFKKQKPTAQPNEDNEADISHLILSNLKEIREYARVIIAEQQAGQYYILSSLERLEGRQPGELSELADKLAARLQEKLTFARKSIAENDSRISS